jgi:hypothetical protein
LQVNVKSALRTDIKAALDECEVSSTTFRAAQVRKQPSTAVNSRQQPSTAVNSRQQPSTAVNSRNSREHHRRPRLRCSYCGAVFVGTV